VAFRLTQGAIRSEWNIRPWSIVAAGILIQLAYLLVLAALETSRVSYIAPSREIGIVFGATLGVVFLGEGFGLWRIWASLVIVCGVFILAIAP
jgi:uncharacterized membrane protein